MEKIFVFGSNLSGRHGAGSAQKALQNYGAIYGQGYGLQGQSFAIPTKDEELKTLSLSRIEKYVQSFIKFATLNPQLTFEVVRIGCGLAGYEDDDMAPLFKDAPMNCILPSGWRTHEGP